jgi:hypothetical protein
MSGRERSKIAERQNWNFMASFSNVFELFSEICAQPE